MKRAIFFCFALLMLGPAQALMAQEPVEAVHQWGVFEASFYSQNSYEDPWNELEVTVEFTGPNGESITRRAYWDGGHFWEVRFSPNALGEWRYETVCSNQDEGGLHGMTGVFECVPYEGVNPLYWHGALRVSEDRTHFEHADGTPFFFLADTAWNGALRSYLPNWERFLETRVDQQFTAVQFVMTQWRAADTDALGQKAYTGEDPIRVNPAFYQRLDAYFEAVNDAGLAAVPVMLWAISGDMNPGYVLSEEDRISLARYQEARYGAHQVIWFLGGDGAFEEQRAEPWKRIGRAVFGEGKQRIATMHPRGMSWVGAEFREEPWFDFIGYQSGHGDSPNTLRFTHSGPPAENWGNQPRHPVINIEPNYEDHISYHTRTRHDAFSVRRASYWSLLAAPTAGVSYGNNGVWPWLHEYGTPPDHGGAGASMPWYINMTMEGALDMKHLHDFFAALDWHRLWPAQAMWIQSSEELPRLGAEATEVFYSRNAEGEAKLYLDGQLAAEMTVGGEVSAWEADMRLALGNELSGERAWLGELHEVALFDQAISPGEDQHEPVAHYDFSAGEGNVIKNQTGQSGLDLVIEDPDAVAWMEEGGIAIQEPARIATETPAARLIEAVKESGAFSLYAQIKPANTSQDGPARIVTLSRNSVSRNFTLGQDGADCVMRFRTTQTSDNGEPALSTSNDPAVHEHVAVARAKEGDLAVAYLPVGGDVTLDLSGMRSGLVARWYDPREGIWHDKTPIEPETQTFSAPSDEDWLLAILLSD